MYDVLKNVSEPSLKRVFLFIEEGNWQKADMRLEDILNQDPENGYAYLGKLMIDVQVHVFSELMELAKPLDQNINYNRCMRYCEEQLVRELINVNKAIIERKQVDNKVKDINGSTALSNKIVEYNKSSVKDDGTENQESMKMVFRRIFRSENIAKMFSIRGSCTLKEFYAVVILSVALLLIGILLFAVIDDGAVIRESNWSRHIWPFIALLPFSWLGLYIGTMACVKRMGTTGIKFSIAVIVPLLIIAVAGIIFYRNCNYNYGYTHWWENREAGNLLFLLDFLSGFPASALIYEIIAVGIMLYFWKHIQGNR